MFIFLRQSCVNDRARVWRKYKFFFVSNFNGLKRKTFVFECGKMWGFVFGLSFGLGIGLNLAFKYEVCGDNIATAQNRMHNSHEPPIDSRFTIFRNLNRRWLGLPLLQQLITPVPEADKDLYQ